MYYNFDSKKIPSIQTVGGKAHSLIKLTNAGFNVPEGAVLTVEFFNGWLNELRSLETFKTNASNPEKFSELATALKKHAEGLSFNDEQIKVIESITNRFKDSTMFAVRSSSPEEDLSGASFAGGYETILGVKPKNMKKAIKEAFISCLDERVFFYKHQNGFDTGLIRIAVIIQKQINSEVSGVAFSLNPLNNFYDEAVINANTGLGESVVSGMVTPDEIVLDKVNEKIVDKKLGKKDKSIVLLKDGGTETVNAKNSNFAITDDQAIELLKELKKIEAFYNHPVDIEWAFSENQLYILQSRPITTYIPLPEELQTKPEEDPILYLDGSLTKQGINVPISYMGCDILGRSQSIMMTRTFGKDCTKNLKVGLAGTSGGRMYLNASSSLKMQGKKGVVNAWKMSDAGTAELIESLDVTKYTPKKTPEDIKGLKWGAIKMVWAQLSVF
ncbi:PEP/pyruvate-binding domain-containing protein [Fusibacter sp. JL216-2]|uniref:PEP/pyruvate-binding domain-containing protein n=1 Tax=Fusibacter sp. JL216-2 TaxID=3071453 RepID=UPI003D331EFF